MLDVFVRVEDTDKLKVVRVVGSNQEETVEHITISDMIASLSYYLNSRFSYLRNIP